MDFFVLFCVFAHLQGKRKKKKKSPSCLITHFCTHTPGYLNSTLHDECGEFRNHKVHTFEAGLFEFEDLLFDNRLEGQVRGKEPRSEKSWESDCKPLQG